MSMQDMLLNFWVFSVLVEEYLMAFGISDEAIRRALANKGRISANDIHLDEEHPPPEALGFCLIHIKPYINADAWKRISTASMLFCCSCIMDQVKFIQFKLICT